MERQNGNGLLKNNKKDVKIIVISILHIYNMVKDINTGTSLSYGVRPTLERRTYEGV